MKLETLVLSDGHTLYYHSLFPEKPKALVYILHGLNEHKNRYIKVQEALLDQGYASIVPDRRGHGQSISPTHPLGHTGSLERILQDHLTQIDEIKKAYPDLDLVLLGHSFGSILARLILKTHDQDFRCLILTGTPNYRGVAKLAALIADISTCLHDPRSQSPLLNKLGYGTDSKDLSWLSTDKENIRNYLADPLCQFHYSRQSYGSIYKASLALKDPFQAKEPDLPILSMIGGKDPVTGKEKGHQNSLDLLASFGYKKLNSLVYPDLAHEVLNENSPQVYRDLMAFIEKIFHNIQKK